MLSALAGFAAKALLPSEKKIDKDKFFAKKKTTAIQKIGDKSSDIKSPIVKKKTISTNLFLPQAEIKALPPAAEVKKGVKSGKLDDIFDRVGETLQGIIDVLSNRNQTQKEEENNKKQQAKIEDKKEKEENLEKEAKKKPFMMPNIQAPEDKFNLMKFFGNVLLGSLALAIFNNLEQIIETLKNVFQTIKDFIQKLGEFFSPIWNGLKWITGKGTELIGKLLGVPSENLDDKDIKKNLDEIVKKIPFLENLFKGIENTINSLRGGGGETTQPQPEGAGGGSTGERPIGGGSPGQWGPVLDAIKSAEMGRGGYESMYPSTSLPGATNMTLQEVANRATGAVGAYQFLDPVGQGRLAGLKPTDKFSPANQDKMAIALITKKRRVTLNMIKTNPDESMIRLGMEWAGLPMPKRMQGAKRVVEAGQSYYSGDGRNKAHVSVKQMRTVFAKMGAPSVQQQSQRNADITAQQAAQQMVAPTQEPSTPQPPPAAQTQAPPASMSSSSQQAAQITATVPSVQPPVPTQAQVASTQAPPAISASVPQIMQQAEYEVPGGASSSTILPIPIGGGSSPSLMSGGGTRMLPIGVSKQALLNSYYQAQLIGFLYKQG
jgi:hypothetical protein